MTRSSDLERMPGLPTSGIGMKTSRYSLLIGTHLAVGLLAGMGVWMASKSATPRSGAGIATMTTRSDHGRGDGSAAESGMSGATNRAARRSVVSSASSAPVHKSLDDIRRIADPLERMTALAKLLDAMPADGFAAFLEQYRSMDHYGDTGSEQEMILRAWAKLDPAGAVQAASDRGSNRDTMTVLAAWAGQDPAAAEAWARDHADGDKPNRWMAAVIRGLAAHDLDAASQLAQEMPASRERGWAMEAITRALMVDGAEAAMAFPATLKAEHLRAGFTAMIAGRIAERDPAAAAAWVASADTESQRQAAETVARAMARQDVDSAAAWVNKLDPRAKAAAASVVIPAMAEGDIANITKTANWVSGFSATPNFDRMAEEFVWCCDYREPEQSAAWIQAVSDPGRQEKLYHRMLGEWSRRDAGAVRSWVASNQVPESVSRRFASKKR